MHSFQDEVEQNEPMSIAENEDNNEREMDLKEKVLFRLHLRCTVLTCFIII